MSVQPKDKILITIQEAVELTGLGYEELQMIASEHPETVYATVDDATIRFERVALENYIMGKTGIPPKDKTLITIREAVELTGLSYEELRVIAVRHSETIYPTGGSMIRFKRKALEYYIANKGDNGEIQVPLDKKITLSVREAMALTGIGQPTIRRIAENVHGVGLMVGRCVRLKRKELERFLSNTSDL